MILNISKGHFLDHGYAGTTMSGIAASLGGSKGTLWSYFACKEDLFTAVLERMVREYTVELSQILDPHEEFPSTLKRACLSLIHKITSDEAIALHRLIISECRRFPNLSQIFFDLAPRNTRALIAQFLDSAMVQGQLRRADAEEAARTLSMLCAMGCHHQLLMGQITAPDAALIERDAESAVNIFLSVYSPG